mmetsp:Transcript_7177/g.14501  ORF Transcript_7177/g.14501 Transcript_7177/m.14501 type:complete len:1267 (-) Transcript_7177:3184-6984(-)
MSSSPPINDKGCCPIHPVIQLQRKQRRTGEWKVILSSCPLCVSGLPPMESTGGVGGGGAGVESSSRGERDRESERDDRDRASRTPSSARERKGGRLNNSINNYVSDEEYGDQDANNNYVNNNMNNNRAPHNIGTNHRNNHIDDDQDDEGDEESSVVSHSSRLSHHSRHSVSSQATFKQRGGGRSAPSSRLGDRGGAGSHEAWLLEQQQQQQQHQLGVRFHPETKGPSEKGIVPIDDANEDNPSTSMDNDEALAASHQNKPAMPPSVLKPSKFGPSAVATAVNSGGNSTGGDVDNGGGMRRVTSNNNFHDRSSNNGNNTTHMNNSNINGMEEPPEELLPPGYENCLVPYEPDSNNGVHHGDGPFDSSINSLEDDDGPVPTYYEDRINASAAIPNSSFVENNNHHINNNSRSSRDPSVHGSVNSAASGSSNGKQYPPPPPKNSHHNQNSASALNTPNTPNTPSAVNGGGDNMDMDYCREVAGGPPRPPNGIMNNNKPEENLHSSIQSNISSSYHSTGAGASVSNGRRDRDQSRQRDRDQIRQRDRDQSRQRDRSRGRDGGHDPANQPGPPPPRSRSRSRSKSRGATRGASVGRSGNAHSQMTPQPNQPTQSTPQSAPPSILRSESRTRTRDRSESRSRARDAPPPQHQHHHPNYPHSSGSSVNSSNRPTPPPPMVPSLPNHYRGGMDPQEYNHPGQDADEFEDDDEEEKVLPLKQQHNPGHPHDRMNQYPPGQGLGGHPRGPPPPNSGNYRGDPRGDPNGGNYHPNHYPHQGPPHPNMPNQQLPHRRDSAPQPMDRRMRGPNVHRQGPRGGEPPAGSNFPPGSFQSPGATFPNNNNRMPKAPSSAPVHFPSRNNNNGNDNSSQMSEGSRRQSMQHQYQHNQQHSDQGPAPPPTNRPGISPGPKQRKTAAKDSSTFGQTESETQPEEDSEIDQNDSDSFLPMAKASEYDEKGRCVKHPHIKLRKKKMLGGWKVLLVNCPDCCIEEMLKMRKSGADKAAKANAKSNGGADNRRPAQRRGSKGEESESSGLPPISQLTISHRKKSSNSGGPDDENQSASSGSASEITYGTKTDFSRFSAGGNMSWQNYSGDHSGSTPGSGPHRVTRMPFTDAYGDRGWYTGDVASGSGLPSGIGTMHYVDGRVRQGRWSNGLADDGPPNKGGNRRIGSGNSVNSNDNYNRTRHPFPPSSGNSVGSRKSKVVCGMQWTDYRGNSGFFTGETDEDGEPDGMGSMRYHSGEVLEGKWTHGEFEGRGGGGGRSVSSSSKGGRVRL